SVVAWGGHETNWGQLDVPEGYHYVAIAAGTVHNLALAGEPPAPGPFFYVDVVNGDDMNNGQTPETAYATIQRGIDSAKDGYTVVVRPGLYLEPESDDSIDFLGKNITLRSADPTDWDVVDSTVIRGGVQFAGTEGPNCTLTGFTIHDRYYGAIYGNHTRATISHCVISGNGPCGATVIKECDGTISNCLITDNTTFFWCGIYPVLFGCNGLIKNCTIASNISGISLGNATVENCIIYNNSSPQLHIESGGTLNISYSNVAGGLEGIAGEGQVHWGPGNIDTDPCFVRSGYPLEEPLEPFKGEYHLKSAGWRWNKESKSWTYDYVTSRCVDAGNPGSPLGDELMSVPRDPDNEWGVNLRINMGAYGGTSQASMPPHGWALLTDLNNDGIVNCADLVEQAMDWLADATEQPGDLKRDGVVDMKDFSALAGDWLQPAVWLNTE
ncbi:MAG: right-handed parallel beta-helix repeat-containing protein, partial [Phycisphaerales bacterium]